MIVNNTVTKSLKYTTSIVWYKYEDVKVIIPILLPASCGLVQFLPYISQALWFYILQVCCHDKW